MFESNDFTQYHAFFFLFMPYLCCAFVERWGFEKKAKSGLAYGTKQIESSDTVSRGGI